MNKLKKAFIIFFSSVMIIVVVIILFASPIAKYLIEKYDSKYTGRQITLDWAYLNPFTGFIHLDDLKIMENNGDSLFLSAKGLSANFELIKLFSQEYEISKLELDQPVGYAIQGGDKHYFNFNDIVDKFTPKKDSLSKRRPVHFSILRFIINDGEFHYVENTIPVNYFIKEVNIDCGGIRWDTDTIPIRFSFLSGIGGGKMEGDMTINSANKDYRLNLQVRQFDLNVIGQFLRDFSNYGSFRAKLDADFKSKGNFTDGEKATNSGKILVNDFHYGRNVNDDYAAFDKLIVDIREVSPKKRRYIFDSVALVRPWFKYEKYDHLDNFQKMFGSKGSNITEHQANAAKFNLVIEIAHYMKVLSKNFFKSNYKVDRLAIYEGNLAYEDFSMEEKFSTELNPLFVIADSINKTNDSVKLTLRSGVKPYGRLAVDFSINPKDSSDFNVQYFLQELPTSMFNPYITTSTSFPLDRGTLELNGNWIVSNGFIKSNNHVLVVDPRLATKVKRKSTRWLPMKFVMYIIREKGNVIDYEIPITGNLKDPQFHLKDVLTDALKNLFIKPVTTPYQLEVKHVETEIEKSMALTWKVKSSFLQPIQRKFVTKMADFLKENPQAKIDVYPLEYTDKEKEQLLFFEAKKKYYMMKNHVNEKNFCDVDTQKVDQMSIKDPQFTAYLNKQVCDSMLFTNQEKCYRLLGEELINSRIDKLNTERREVFLTFFKEKGVERQVNLSEVKPHIPYNGFSFYKIVYKHDFPESLIKAYRKMNDLDNREPRKEFKKVRGKTKKVL